MLNDNIGEVIQIQKTLINNEKMKFRYLKKKRTKTNYIITSIITS